MVGRQPFQKYFNKTVICYCDSQHEMPSHTNLDREKRAVINSYCTDGLSIRTISSKLKIPKSTVAYAIQRYRETRSNFDRSRCGRPRKTTKQEDKSIVLLSKRNRRRTAPEITADFNNCHKKEISVDTVKRRLRSAGLYGRVAVQKPLLRPQNKKKRLQWAKEHKNWTIDDFKNVFWTDESKFEIFGSKRRTYVRRSVNKKMLPACITPTVKHGGGSVMVWGGFSFNGISQLYRIKGILEKKQYHKILVHKVVPAGMQLIGRGFIMQQDNDPKHISGLCKNYLKKKEKDGTLKIMIWPPQSPDLNPVELLWEEIDRHIRKRCLTSQENLWTVLEEEWNNLDKQKLKNLIKRMPRIVKAVLKMKGGFFDEKKI